MKKSNSIKKLRFKDYLKLIPVIFLRTIKWLYLKIKTRNKELIKDIQGSKMILDFSGPIIDFREKNIFKQLALDGIRERESTKIMKIMIKPGDKILEIGANIGYYVLLEAKLLEGRGKIYAIEPGPKNLELLNRNIELNNIFPLVEVYHLAVSDKTGEFPLYIAPESNLHTMVKPLGGSDFINIKTTTVDDFLKDKETVDFVRMDVEGYEYEIIKGMERLLQKTHPFKMFIELHPHLAGRDKIIELLKILMKHDFEIKHLIYFDTYLRRALGHCQICSLTIEELLESEIIGECGLYVFFERFKNPMLV